MSERVRVCVHATDPISRAGLIGQLRGRPEVLIVEGDDEKAASVGLVGADEFDSSVAVIVRSLVRRGTHVVVVASRLDDAGVLGAVEAGACGLMRRSEAEPERIVNAIGAARSGDGSLPPDLLGRLLGQVGQLQRQVLSPRGLTMNGMTERELEVLRLVADGYDTRDIAAKLCYSERTVKNVLHDVTTRLNLRNRAHAVAHAIRTGLI